MGVGWGLNKSEPNDGARDGLLEARLTFLRLLCVGLQNAVAGYNGLHREVSCNVTTSQT